ncbi:MAG: tRNA threonylcarbamoyladenosine biosynthesis protein TsaE [Paracoccaceae bacterium]
MLIWVGTYLDGLKLVVWSSMKIMQMPPSKLLEQACTRARHKQSCGMTQKFTHSTYLQNANDTAALGRWFSHHVILGDTLLLSGPIGAGKTHFARALIQSKVGELEDVPSPSFTLVQTYEAPDFDIWHADLYRLSHPEEVVELGLEDAFSSAVCLVEWPDRLGQATPKSALWLEFAAQDEGRLVTVSGSPRFDLAFALLEDWPNK